MKISVWTRPACVQCDMTKKQFDKLGIPYEGMSLFEIIRNHLFALLVSDIQDLIHKTSMDCLEKGKRMEQERIIKLLEEHEAISDGSEGGNPAVCSCQQWSLTSESYEDHIKRLIKGEK